MMLSRRHLLSAATGVAFAGLSRMAAAQPQAPAGDSYLNEVTGYGPLKEDPQRIFDLPEGFSYTVVSRAGDPMSDGLVTPYKMDGMAAFPLSRGRVALVRNHELRFTDFDYGPFGKGQTLAGQVDRARVFDAAADGRLMTGGTTTLVYDPKSKRLESSWLSLAGTNYNCAGGATPWGSWLTCEETTRVGGAGPDNLDLGKSHGWVFEVPARHKGLVDPVPLTALGRFKHEAACIDPRTGIVYLTEDEPDGRCLFYRVLPVDRRRLERGGRMQVLGFRDRADSRNWTEVTWTPGDWREVVWIDLEGPENPHTDLRDRGHAKGAAWFARGEGIHFGDGEMYFTCTSGGPKRLGQILRYRPSRFEGDAREAGEPGRMQLFLEPSDNRVMNMCDNLTVAPWGHLIVCEDKVEPKGVNFLKGVTPDGRTYALGRVVRSETDGPLLPTTELAGVCFSPDGSTLFVNSYWPGATLAITGPWKSFKA
ncbi:alkaline phosphatase PhoX [Phenylobacterium sp. SCN 70-31]|uniref:alkaline phosphatase PhoX n=1 Tax=Phenylobacterium sp. SCN 70-31 TaxID=1660129 RepID=UPI0008699D6C|nr:alkaline phosphatase PhoX [Phenylobacterium sp. SCN 70-31]ODT88030.1 MAG: phosphatase [Phenylobacterium sp. SCN 70-31]